MLETVLQLGKDAGFADLEVFREKLDKRTFESFGDRVVDTHTLDGDRIGVRAFWETGDPIAYQLSRPDPDRVARAFANIYSLRPPDRKPNYAHLLPAAAHKVALDIYDDSFEAVDHRAYGRLLERLEAAVLKFPGLRLNRVSLTTTLSKVYVANTNGLDIKYIKTVFNLLLNFGLKDNLVDISESKIYFDHFQPFKIVSRAHNLLESLTGDDAGFTGNTFFILAPEASTSILKEFSPFLKADGRDVKIDFSFPAILNIVDDPLLDGRPGSVPFDDEGVQGKECHLVRKGVPIEKISNIQTAFSWGGQSTGNGFRSDNFLYPQVRFSNLYIKPTILSLENLMKDAGRGVLVSLIKLKRIHKDKHLFSAYGYRFLNDRLQEPVHLYFKTSFLSYFLNILKVSRELRFFYSNYNIGSPFVLLEGQRKKSGEFEI